MTQIMGIDTQKAIESFQLNIFFQMKGLLKSKRPYEGWVINLLLSIWGIKTIWENWAQ